MSPMLLYAIGATILVLYVSIQYPVESLYLTGGLFTLAALGRALGDA